MAEAAEQCDFYYVRPLNYSQRSLFLKVCMNEHSLMVALLAVDFKQSRI